MRDGSRRYVDHDLTAPLDRQPTRLVHLADDVGIDLPPGADLEHPVDGSWRDDGHHPFLRLAHQDLLRSEGAVAQRDPVEDHVHAAVARRRQFRRRARQAGAAQVLDTDDQFLPEELQCALDQQLLHEWIADLHTGPLAGTGIAECLRRQHRNPADAIATGLGAIEDDKVADAGRARAVQLLVAHHADAQRVDQRVAGIRVVEHHFAADVGQAQTVAVATDPGDDAGQHPFGVLGVGGAEPQRVHHRHRPRTHRQDVADDPADSRCRPLVGLDIGRVVVRLDLECHRVALPDVDDAGVLADARQQLADLRLLGQLAEPPQVHLAGFVRAVLGPHHAVHREFAAGGATAENLADPRVFVDAQPQLRPRLSLFGTVRGLLDGIGHVATSAVRTEVKKPSPSTVGPVRRSIACSGCGIKPTTLPRAFVIPAMSR